MLWCASLVPEQNNDKWNLEGKEQEDIADSNSSAEGNKQQ
jgi:hypothetical protein